MLRCLLLCLTLILFSPALIGGQPNQASLWISNMELRLGAEQTTLLKKLENKFKVSHLGHSVYLLSQIDFKTGGYDIVGHASFSGGRLVSASKRWTRDKGEDGIKLSKLLWSILSEFKEDREETAKIILRTNHDPDHTDHTIEMLFRTRRLNVLISESRDGDRRVTIDEIIR